MRCLLVLGLAYSVAFMGCYLDSGGALEPGSGGVSTGGTAGTGVGGTGVGGTGVGGTGVGGTGVGGTGGDVPEAGPDVDASLDVTPDTPLEEICTNGLDDDGDGLVDCDDPDCEPEVMCIPDPPTGWEEPAFLHHRAPAQSAIDCGMFVQGPTLYDGLTVSPHTCSCGCQPATGGMCNTPNVSLHQNAQCSGIIASPFTSYGCFPLSFTGQPPSSLSTNAVGVLSQGTCASSMTHDKPQPTWSHAVDVCRTADVFGGCGAGKRCVRRPNAPLEGEACVIRAGTHTCPAEYLETRTVYTGYVDTRGCTSIGCFCGVAKGGTCSGTIEIHSESACTKAIRSWPLDGECKVPNFGSNETPVAIQLTSQGPTGGTCTPMGSASTTGEVSPGSPHTVCCVPSMQ